MNTRITASFLLLMVCSLLTLPETSVFALPARESVDSSGGIAPGPEKSNPACANWYVDVNNPAATPQTGPASQVTVNNNGPSSVTVTFTYSNGATSSQSLSNGNGITHTPPVGTTITNTEVQQNGGGSAKGKACATVASQGGTPAAL